MRDQPETATDLGDTGYDEVWTDLSLDAIASREAAERKVLQRLRAIPRDRLANAERVQYESFLGLLQDRVDRHA